MFEPIFERLQFILLMPTGSTVIPILSTVVLAMVANMFYLNHSSFSELITCCRCFVRLNLGMIPQECRVKERCSWSHLLEVLIQGHSSKPEQFSSPQAGHGNEGHGFQVTCEKRLQGTRCQLRITTRRKNLSQTWKSDCPPSPTASPTACRMATLHGPQMKVWPTDPPTTQTAYDTVWSDYIIPYVLWSDITWYPRFTHVWLELWPLPLLEDPEKPTVTPKDGWLKDVVPLGNNVNPGLINHGLLIRGYSSNSHYLILFYGTLPIKQPFGLGFIHPGFFPLWWNHAKNSGLIQDVHHSAVCQNL